MFNPLNLITKFIKSSNQKELDRINKIVKIINSLEDQFKKLDIKYIPTVVLFYNGEEVYRVESGISLKLPDNSIQLIENEIEEIIESKF